MEYIFSIHIGEIYAKQILRTGLLTHCSDTTVCGVFTGVCRFAFEARRHPNFWARWGLCGFGSST